MEKEPELLPISLRVTFAENAQLERDAAGMSKSAYIRSRVFDPENPPPRHRHTVPVKDHQALARVLGLLGQSRLANNLNQLARATNSGSLPVTPETEQALVGACSDIAAMKRLVLQALGLDADK